MLNRMALLCAGFLLAATGCGGPAGGDEGAPGTGAKGLERSGKHCVGRTFSQPKGLPAPEKLPETELTCFDSFAGAVSHLSQGRLQLAESAMPEDFTQEHADQLASMGTYVIGVEYEHAGYQGLSLIVSSDFTCVGSSHWTVLSGNYMDNRISSAVAYSGCNYALHYDNSDFTGVFINCGAGCYNLAGAMNDRTSSINWHE